MRWSVNIGRLFGIRVELHVTFLLFIGWIAFCIYQVELRRWLTSENPDLTSGIKRLERALKLYLAGAGTSKPGHVAGNHPGKRRRQITPVS